MFKRTLAAICTTEIGSHQLLLCVLKYVCVWCMVRQSPEVPQGLESGSWICTCVLQVVRPDCTPRVPAIPETLRYLRYQRSVSTINGKSRISVKYVHCRTLEDCSLTSTSGQFWSVTRGRNKIVSTGRTSYPQNKEPTSTVLAVRAKSDKIIFVPSPRFYESPAAAVLFFFTRKNKIKKAFYTQNYNAAMFSVSLNCDKRFLPSSSE